LTTFRNQAQPRIFGAGPKRQDKYRPDPNDSFGKIVTLDQKNGVTRWLDAKVHAFYNEGKVGAAANRKLATND